MHNSSTQLAWTSRFAFLMASIGFAVGLGNIWRFPYVTGENGGGAFVLVYLLCVFCIGLPILMAELMLGRRGRMTPPGSLAKVAVESGQSPKWAYVGLMNLSAAFLILVTYSVVAGWVLNYLQIAVFTGFEAVDAATAASKFSYILAEPGPMLMWTLIAMAATGAIIYAGLQNGIERAVSILMPTLFGLMILLVIYNAVVGGLGEAMRYLFQADFSKITPQVALAAIGQAFFSIGVAMAGMMTYGSYLPKEISVARSALIIIIADTGVALLAGLVIFPAVFSNGLDPAGGPGLIFQTLPVAFASMPGGHLVSIIFFLLLSVAAVTSMVGLVEPLTHYAEEHWGYSRHKSTTVVIATISGLSVISVLSYNILSDVAIFGRDLNSLTDFVSNQVLLPIGGLLIALFAGWFVERAISRDELDVSPAIFSIWRLLIRFVAPPAILIVFFLGLS
jgi:NSS family neurotransmitter:Na+ symporter